MDNVMKKQFVKATIIILVLVFVYPNFVHEPLHYLALKILGGEGIIHFDFVIPSTPYLSYDLHTSIFGWLFFLLLPSLFNVLSLIIIWFTKSKPNYSVHVIFSAYLCFDLIINLIHINTSKSDFRFLQLFPFSNVFLITVIFIYYLILLSSIAKNKVVINGCNNKRNQNK